MKAVLLLALLAFPAQGEDEARSFERVLRALRAKAAPSVVAVEVERTDDPEGTTGVVHGKRGDYYNRPDGPASGTIVGKDGLILTSHFNVSGTVQRITVVLHDGTRHAAELVGYDRNRDVALLKIDAKDLPVLAPAKEARHGDFVAVIGRSPDPDIPTLNHGILSATKRFRGTAVQTDAQLNYGNVGGPLVNVRGELVGVTCHVRPREHWGQSGGIGFATKWAEIERLIPRLAKGEKIEKEKVAWLGVRIGPGDPDREGAQIAQVMPESPAAKAGLKAGDVIVAVDGAGVADAGDLEDAIEKKRVGDEVTVKVVRGEGEKKEEVEIRVKLEERP